MAKVLGEPGRYTSQQAVNERRRTFLLVCILTGVFGCIEGFLISSFAPSGWIPGWVKLFGIAGALIAVYVLLKWGEHKIDELEKRRVSMLRGTDGEEQVSRALADFPDEFCVINGLSTPFGDLDHVVVGPTGVFVLDTKNWRGVVSNNGKGELRVNDKPTDKPEIQKFVARMMGIKDQVRTLSSGLDPFYQAAFVFPSARVEAKWGSTGHVHCIRLDQIHDYIVKKDFGNKLNPDQVQRLAQAFLGLAHMDREFTKNRGSPAT